MGPGKSSRLGNLALGLGPARGAGVGLALVIGAAVAFGCGGDAAVAPKIGAPPSPPPIGLRPFGPAQYLQRHHAWIERTTAGTDLVLSNGRRAEIKGNKTVRTDTSDVDLVGGAAIPAWVKGAARYAFWSRRDVYVSAAFLGPLVKVATMPADVSSRSFDWLDGLAIEVDSSLSLVVPGASPDLHDTRVVPLAVPALVGGLAADGKRAVATNVFGRSLLTIDGGKTFRDIHDEVGEIHDYEVRGGDLVLFTAGDGRRFVGPDGKLADSAVSPGPRRGSIPPDVDDQFAEVTADDALYDFSDSAIPLDDGVLLAVTGDHVARVDARTGDILNATPLDEVGAEDCRPVRLPDALLLVCRGAERAMVIDITGVPKIERTFEVAAADEIYTRIDAYSVADGIGVGYLGPCSGPPPVRDEVDAISGASSRNQSPQRSPVFCARASADHWVEHRLGPEDAADVVGWMPRPGGDAVALVARATRHVPDEDRTTTQGPLRVVRIPRNEPPLSLAAYSARSYVTATREMRALADGSIEAWFISNNYGNNTVAAIIDADGHVRARPAPQRVESIEHEGPFALARGDDGKLYETVDWGKRWIEVAPPPGAVDAQRPSGCSSVGCLVSGHVRLGWDSVDPKIPPAVADYEASRAAARRLREKNEYRRPSQKPAAVKLACSYAAPGEGARQSDSYAFGFTASSMPRMGGASRLGLIGSFTLPWWQGPMPSGVDIDLAWVDPLDLDARVRRATIPLARAGVSLTNRPYELRLGYVLDEEGRVEIIPTGQKDVCVAPVLHEAGITLDVGGCLEEGTIGVRIKDRILAATARWGSVALTAIDLPSVGGGSVAVGTAQRELRTLRASYGRGTTAGIGVRAGNPVGVAVNGRGEASLAPIDPNDGYVGEVEPLAPLTALRIATDEKCPTQDRLSADEARVLMPFDTDIGLARDALPGVIASGSTGVAVIRWSKQHACLEAIEMPVKDDRFDMDGGNYEPPGVLRKLVARFVKAPPKRGRASDRKASGATSKAAPAASASASASAASPAPLPPWASPYGPPPPAASASASASATVTAAPIPVSPPLPRGAGEGTLVIIQYGSELRQKLFCTGTTP